MELKPGYKQTEVGVIPEEWDVKRLGECATFRTGPFGSALHKSDYITDGVPLVNPMHIVSGGIKPSSDASVTEEVASSLSDFRLKTGEIVIGRRGDMGRCAVVRTAQDGWLCGTGSMIIRCKEGVSADYLQRILASPSTIAAIEATSVGSTMINLNQHTLSGLRIALPRPREQEATASALNDLDELQRSLESLIAKKRDIKQAAMQELLTGKRRLPGFEGEWEETTVKDVVTRSFCGPSPTCQERNIEGNDEWGVLKTTAITWENGWSWKAHKLLPTSYWGKSEIELRQGDVLVTKAGPRHRVGVSAWVDQIPQRIIPSGKMIALRPNPKRAEPLMLAAAIACRRTQIHLDQRTTGMAESQVNFENAVLLSAPIRLPSIAEQTAISEICTEFDKELKALEAKVATIRNIKEGMMQQLLTGKIRLQ